MPQTNTIKNTIKKAHRKGGTISRFYMRLKNYATKCRNTYTYTLSQ